LEALVQLGGVVLGVDGADVLLGTEEALSASSVASNG
jgi:hypothetical protein